MWLKKREWGPVPEERGDQILGKIAVSEYYIRGLHDHVEPGNEQEPRELWRVRPQEPQLVLIAGSLISTPCCHCDE